MVKRILVAAVAAVVLQLVPTAAGASSPPPTPGQWRADAPAGCWKSTLREVHQRRTYTLSGHTFVLFRRVVTALHWCPGSGYAVRTWASPWGPGRR